MQKYVITCKWSWDYNTDEVWYRIYLFTNGIIGIYICVQNVDREWGEIKWLVYSTDIYH